MSPSSIIRVDEAKLASEGSVYEGRRFVGFLKADGKEPPVVARYLRLPCSFQKRGDAWVLGHDVQWPRTTHPWGRIVMVGVWLGMGREDTDPLAVIPLDVNIPRGAKLRFRAGDLAFDKTSLTDFARNLVRGTGLA